MIILFAALAIIFLILSLYFLSLYLLMKKILRIRALSISNDEKQKDLQALFDNTKSLRKKNLIIFNKIRLYIESGEIKKAKELFPFLKKSFLIDQNEYMALEKSISEKKYEN